MNTIFIKSGYSETSDPVRILLNLSDKLNLMSKDKYVALSNLSIYYTWKNIKKSYKNNTFKISAPTWKEEFELHYGSYSLSSIQDSLKYILIKHGTVTDSPSIMIYVNKMENRIRFQIKTGYYLEMLMHETMKLFGRTKSKVTKDENDENVSHLEFTETVLIHCNMVNNNYQQDL